jgi:hypothetical protein
MEVRQSRPTIHALTCRMSGERLKQETQVSVNHNFKMTSYNILAVEIDMCGGYRIQDDNVSFPTFLQTCAAAFA